MSAVDQTIFVGDPRQGNCLSACVASFLDRPLDQVPHFAEYDLDEPNAWWHLLIGYMAGHGYWPLELDDPHDAEVGEVVFVCGPSPRGVLHQVLYRDGALWHDPHPSRAGVLAVTEVLVWRPVRHDHASGVRWDVCPWHPASPETADRGRARGAGHAGAAVVTEAAVWAVAEFDAARIELCRWVELEEAEARDLFVWVTQERQNRSDVVRRSEYAALVCGEEVVEAAPLHRSRRAPFLANKRLEHLDVESRERIARLEVLGVDLAKAATRRDGTPRRGPVWPLIRGVACELWTLTRGATATVPLHRGEPVAWWLIEWTCRCSQVERVRDHLHERCPYHDEPPIPHSPQLVDDGC